MLLHVLLHLLNLVLGHMADFTLVVTVEIMVVGANLVAMTMVVLYNDNLRAWWMNYRLMLYNLTETCSADHWHYHYHAAYNHWLFHILEVFVSLATRFDILFLVYDGKITAKNLIAKLVFPKLKEKIPIAYKGNPTYFAYILYILKSASNLNGNLNCSKELEHYASW